MNSDSTIGILGGGQLARMLALAGYPLGIQTLCLDPSDFPCANQVSTYLKGEYNDVKMLDKLLEQCQIITFENENIPMETAEYCQQNGQFYPSSKALSASQDRLLEKQFVRSQNIPTADFHPVNNTDSLHEAAQILGLPFLLKTRRLGYDGKGQFMIKDHNDLASISKTLPNVPLIAEKLVAFKRELSILAVRSIQETAFYPLTENHHQQGILRLSRAPFIHEEHQKQAEDIARKLLIAMDYIGVLAIELFETEDNLLVNEIAPRVHNSGHWTIEGAHTSQFENHLRAVMNLPLGNTAPKGFSAMVNAIGQLPHLSELAGIPFCHIHDYQKPPRPGRKVGHITLNTENPDLLHTLLAKQAVQAMLTC